MELVSFLEVVVSEKQFYKTMVYVSPNILCSDEYSSTAPLNVQELLRRFPLVPVSQIFTVPSAEADTNGAESAVEPGNNLKSQMASVCPIYVVTFKEESRIVCGTSQHCISDKRYFRELLVAAYQRRHRELYLLEVASTLVWWNLCWKNTNGLVQPRFQLLSRPKNDRGKL